MNYDHDSLKELFDQIEETVGRCWASSIYSMADARKFENASDDDYFHVMIHVIFCSGLPSELAENRMVAIDRSFTQYRAASYLDNQRVAQILQDPAIAKHDRKIRRIIAIARSFRTVVSEFGSFHEYLDSMGGRDIESLLALRTDLMRRFTFLGKRTSLLFLIELGYPILKPGRAVLRVLVRLGLVHPSIASDYEPDRRPLNERQSIIIVRAGARIAEATQKPVPYISEVLNAFAQGDVAKGIGFGVDRPAMGICSEERPSCHLCGARDRCRYQNKTQFPQRTALAGRAVWDCSGARSHRARSPEHNP
jgi:DNA-3-methyladenine glycosylase I